MIEYCWRLVERFDNWLDDHELLKGSAWYYYEAKRLEALEND
jgi:hypothetical protein